MLQYLFTSVNLKTEFTPRKTYAAFLTDIAREASDARDALNLFDKLVSDEHATSSSVGCLSFDAHGGDTGCHLRAGMLEDLICYARCHQDPKSPSKISHASIRAAQDKLDHVIRRSQHICHQLTHERTPPKLFELGVKKDVPASLLRACEWYDDLPQSLVDDDHVSVTEHDRPSPLTNQLLTERSRQRTSSNHGDSKSDFAFSRNPSESSSRGTSPNVSSRSRSSHSSVNESRWRLSTSWEMSDLATMVRFLVYSFALTKYKTFLHDAKGPICRLNPEKAFEYGARLMDPYWNTRNVDYQIGICRRIGFQLKAMQKWMTDLSCSWLKSLADRSEQNCELGNLVASTLQVSPAGLSVAACYPAYLLQRHHWAAHGIPIVFVDLHFCPKGYHWNIFKVPSIKHETTKIADASPLASTACSIQHMTIEQLQESKTKGVLSIVIFGHSMEGSYSEYLDRVAQGVQAVRRHHHVQHIEEGCSRNVSHIHALLVANLDQIMLSTFAAHQQYPWCPLSSGQSGKDFVLGCMDEVCAHAPSYRSHPYRRDDRLKRTPSNAPRCRLSDETEVKSNFLADAQAASAVGASRDNISTFNTQHIFLETEARLAALLRYRVDNPERETFLPFAAEDDTTVSAPISSPRVSL